jgi:hypothetical protein
MRINLREILGGFMQLIEYAYVNILSQITQRSQRNAAFPYLQILTNDKLEVKHIKKGARIK